MEDLKSNSNLLALLPLEPLSTQQQDAHLNAQGPFTEGATTFLTGKQISTSSSVFRLYKESSLTTTE